jgi:hypothetical protein
MLSRATTFGDEDGLNSAIYFIGSDLTCDRIKKLTLKTNTNVPLVNVARQSAWVSHLEQNVVDVSGITDEMLAGLVAWADKKVDYDVCSTTDAKSMRQLVQQLSPGKLCIFHKIIHEFVD